jgi:hypothetical protein
MNSKSFVCTFKKTAKKVLCGLSKSYSKKQAFKAEFLALVPSIFEGKDSEFVSRACPPLEPSPFNMVVLHPMVVAKNMRQEQISKRLCIQTVLKMQRYLPEENKMERCSPKDEKRFSDFHVLMLPVIPSSEAKGDLTWNKYALFCQPEIHRKIIPAKKNLFMKKMIKLASEGRLALPRRRSVVSVA